MPLSGLFCRGKHLPKSRVEIVELRIQKGSKLCDVALMNLENVVKCKVLVCAVSRDGVVEIPSGHFILREGDHLFITATAEMLTQLLRNLGIITHKAKRVIICGGGRIGYYLSTWLAREGVSVQLIEQDEARCEELSGKLPPEGAVVRFCSFIPPSTLYCKSTECIPLLSSSFTKSLCKKCCLCSVQIMHLIAPLHSQDIEKPFLNS